MTCEKIRVLVFPCGAENALEIHSAISRCVNVEVWGGSSQSDHGRYVFKNYVGDLPFIQSPNFLSVLNKMLCAKRIDCIFPTHDTVAEYFANCRSEIACRIIMSDDETARICREKRLIYEVFVDCSFTPRIYAKPEEVDTYPVFLKPNIGEGGKNTRRANTYEQAHREISLQPDLLIVEDLPGEELTVDCFTDRHGVLRFAGPRLRSRICYGISVQSKTVALTEEIRAISEEVNRRLHLRGLWFSQLKRARNGHLKLLEISTRVAGTMCVYRQTGVNLPLLSIYDAMDMDVEILSNDFPVEVDRALFNCFQIGVDYDTIYLDLDDTLISDGEVNRYVLLLLYQAANQGKTVHLLTRHEGDVRQTLGRAKIHPDLFQSIRKFDWQTDKTQAIRPGERAIFIDNSFTERKRIKSQAGIPVFDVDAVPSLLNWKS